MVYSLDTMLSAGVEGTATTRRLPEFDSHAIASSPRSGVRALAVISTKFPHALPSQIHAFASLFVASPPRSPILSLPSWAASSMIA